MGLVDIPDYLLGQDVDLRYRRNLALRKEIPFVDSFTINRFLGGYREEWLRQYGHWNDEMGVRSLDYAVRGTSGKLEYRPDLIRTRLAPYLEAGYRPKDITLALENIPWDLADDRRGWHHQGPWGQNEPPKDLQRWRDVVSQFARDLQAYLGAAATEVGFETGVEYDERVSFDASEDEFYRYYSATDAGLRAVLPEALLSPGEFTGLGKRDSPAGSVVYDTREFVQFANANGLRLSCVPRSLHSLFNSADPTPSAAVRRAEMSYARIPGSVAEIHQFGLLGQPFSDNADGDPGPVQANWQFQALIGLWQRIKPRRVFHWSGFDNVGKLQFLNGTGFLRLVLDRYLGSQATLLPIEQASHASKARRTELMAVSLSGWKASAIVASSFSAIPSRSRQDILIHLPRELLARASSLKVLRYRASDNVYCAVRADLAAAANLKTEFLLSPLYAAKPLAMAREHQRAIAMLHQNWPRYVDAMKRDLKWRVGDPEIALDGQYIRINLEPNELLVAELAH